MFNINDRVAFINRIRASNQRIDINKAAQTTQAAKVKLNQFQVNIK